MLAAQVDVQSKIQNQRLEATIVESETTSFQMAIGLEVGSTSKGEPIKNGI